MKCGDTSSGPALINRNIGRGKHEFKNKPEKKVGAQRVEGRNSERERRVVAQRERRVVDQRERRVVVQRERRV